jgi:endonuclease I
MKNKILSLAAALLIAAGALAQTTLPTSWSFVGTPPNGWTQMGTSTYTGSGNTPPAGKFDSSGDWLQIWFSDAPGALTYYLTGNSFSGGTFTVEESVNGTTWTALRTITAPPTVYTLYTDIPNTNSRYIRFYYTQKVTGNIGVDDINLALGAAGPTQEMNVVYNSSSVQNNGTVYFNGPVLSTTPVTLSIENQGTVNTLNLTSATISGTNQSEFVISSSPTSVNASSSASLVIDFTPTQPGTRLATLTITNNDPNESPYVINLYGVGGTYATEPLAGPTNFTATNIKSYRHTVSFTAASPAPDGYIVLKKAGSPVTDVPADGMVYGRGDVLGTSKVAYVGSATTFIPNEVYAGITYYYAVFAYNGPGQYRNYAQLGVLPGTVTSAGNMMGNYYSGINANNSNFVTALHNLINPHTQVYYSNYATTMIDKFTARDTVNGQMVVTCVYSGEQYVYTIPFDWSVMSREHTYAHSWMPTNPATGMPEYDDQHNLFPTDLNNANVPRSNYPFGEVVNATYTFMGCKLGTDVNGHTVFEPRAQQKGDLARALMYMAVSYNGVSGNNWGFPDPISASIPYGQDQNLIRKWHYQDPPDAFEIARNDFLDSLQGNRNPFVDSVQFACYIDFDNMSYISNPTVPCQNTSTGISEENDNTAAMEVYPNPAHSIFTVSYNVKGTEEAVISVVDIAGRIVYENRVMSAGRCQSQISAAGLAKGVYTIEVRTAGSANRQKLVIE